MLRSLSSAISGLQNHQAKLDVVGNNISNVNTVGYKAEAVRFQEVFSQTVRGGTAPFAGRGGVNPMQIGLGGSMASINTMHIQGSIQSTGQETDLAIEGTGFFVVSDGQRNYFTRDGSFTRDSAGFLTNANGLRLMGWLPDEDGLIDTSQQLSNLNIPLGEDMQARATETMIIAQNLDSATVAKVNYHAENFMSGLSVNGLPEGHFSISGYAAGDLDQIGSVIASTVNKDYFSLYDPEDPESALFTNVGEDQNVMHLFEVTGKSDQYLELNIVQLNKMDGSREVFQVRAHREEGDHDYFTLEADPAMNENLLIAYEGVQIQDLVSSGDRFLLDFAPDEDGIILQGRSGMAENQSIYFNADLEAEQTLYTISMNERSGEVFFGSLSAVIESLEDVGADAVTFNFEPYSYESYVYDSLGNRHDMKFTFTKHAENNTWSFTVQHADPAIQTRDFDGNPYAGRLVFTPTGSFNPEASDIPSFIFDPENDAEIIEVRPDFNGVVQLRESSNVYVRDQDGLFAGELTTFNIEENGIVTGIYTNGMMRNLGQITMATFANQAGLQKMGNNLYDVTANSGEARYGIAGEMGRGMIQSRALEMSNVDLANEFTEMITTNRAFQANTRMITTSDEVLTELVNMKR